MKKSNIGIVLLGLSVFIFLSGCTSLHPKLYPNDYYQKVGQPQAKKDIKYCEKLAAEQPTSKTQKAIEVLRGTAAVLSIVAAANRAYYHKSNAGSIADTSAILDSGPSEEDNEKQFVQTCLKNKGYDVTGWEY